MSDKLKSFTLTELLVVLIITAIVVGMAFAVMQLVQNQVHRIGKNFEKTSALALFEQRLWQDFNQYRRIRFDNENNTLFCQSELDTIIYKFHETFILRNLDTIHLKLSVGKVLFEGKTTDGHHIDAISISAGTELPDYSIFISREIDVTLFMEIDGI